MSTKVSWLEERLNALQQVNYLYANLREQRETAQASADKAIIIAIEDGLKELRQRMFGETTQLVEQIAMHDGIVMAFVAYEGLVMAASGQSDDHELYAAVANQFAFQAIQTAARLQFDDPRQVVIVTNTQKLALIFVKDMILGIVAPRTIELSLVLSQPK
jgi:predicted regulator of Ras-like GTPase activity (Roadblock/LC7/MglB family)